MLLSHCGIPGRLGDGGASCEGLRVVLQDVRHTLRIDWLAHMWLSLQLQVQLLLLLILERTGRCGRGQNVRLNSEKIKKS